MKTLRSMRWLVGLAATVVLWTGAAAWAAESNDIDNVTVQINSALSITDVVGDFTLAFDNTTGTVNGSTSTGQTVIYTVSANNMPNTALTGAVSAKIASALNGIDIKGDPGTYTNTGSTGNATLNESAADFITIGTTAANLMDKPATTGPAGKVLNGNFGVHYRAMATRDLAVGDGGTVALTVTLKDA